jgi:hypothetical protein
MESKMEILLAAILVVLVLAGFAHMTRSVIAEGIVGKRPCVHCRERVSLRATVCPHCRLNPAKK